MEALTFLQDPSKSTVQPVYVLVGDEPFLKRQVLDALRKQLLGDDESPFGWSVMTGDKATWPAVHGELSTLPFLGSRRVVAVDDADAFVTAARDKLEKYLAAPAATGVLILDVKLKTWSPTTRLAKMVPDAGTLACKAPTTQYLVPWCQKWCKATHGKTLTPAAARLLVDLVGPEMGLLDQEMEKLAVYAGTAKQIDTADVDRLVGNSREEDVWQIFNLMAAGETAKALVMLDRLLTQGENPMRLMGAFASKLRSMAQSYRLTTLGKSLSQAMDDVGVSSAAFIRKGMEQQMRHLGGRRLNRVYDWLLQTNMGMRGGSQLPERALLEKLIIQLARTEAR